MYTSTHCYLPTVALACEYHDDVDDDGDDDDDDDDDDGETNTYSRRW